MTIHTSDLHEAARLWVIRLQDSSFDDWDGFTEWLEGAPAHLTAYEAALQAEAWAAELFASRPAAANDAVLEQDQEILEENVVPLRPRRRWHAVGGAIAASALAFAGWSIVQRDTTSDIVTAPGEHRTIALADGSRIMLNGSTRITLDRSAPRAVKLADGEALFEIRHDARDPFVVEVNGTRLLDAGTVFNVISDRGSLDVAVSDGSVIYEPNTKAIRLRAGDGLLRTSLQSEPILRKAPAQSVGGWRSGRLQYSNASLEQIARDLGRNLGQPIRAGSGADRMRFSGTLVLNGSREQVLSRAGPLLGVDFAADGTTWTMTPAHGATVY